MRGPQIAHSWGPVHRFPFRDWRRNVAPGTVGG
jgi:hypothetical protein